MKRFILLIRLEIKKSIKTLPKLLAGGILMLDAVAAIGICANGILNEKADISQEDIPKVGVVCYDNSGMMELAQKALTGTKSISENVNLIFMNEEDAGKGLDSSELIAVIVIPENVIKDIMSGKNTPIEVKFQKNSGYEAAAFKEVADAAVNLLSSAQAGIYSVYDFYKENYRAAYIDDALDRLNARYIKTVLLREGFFDNTTLVATGELDVMEYYMISGMVLFLFLFGINSLTFTEGYRKEITAGLKYSGVGEGKQVIARYAGVICVYIIVQTVAMSAFAAASGMKGGTVVNLWLGTMPVTMAVSAIVLLVQTAVKNKTAAVMTMFFVAVFQAFVTGSFIPQVMLPEVVNIVGKFMPAYYMIEQIKKVYMGGSIINTEALMLLAITAMALFLCSVGTKTERKGVRIL